MARTQERDRVSSMEEAFAQPAPETNLPAAIQQVIMDERPQGAIRVAKERDLQKVMRDIKAVATAAGDDFFYSWPVENKNGTKGIVEGPSVKLTNAVSRIYGNCQVRIRAFDQGPHWILYAQFYDMETGFVLERPYQQRKGQNIGGKMDRDRAQDIVFQIGCSKAARNVVSNALSEFCDYAFDVAKEQLVEKIGKSLDKYRQRVTERLAELKVDIKRVEAVRGKGLKDWLATDVAKTIAEIQAANDGMAHQDELWPPPEAGQARPTMEDFIDDRTPEQKTADKAAGLPDPKTANEMKALIAARAKKEVKGAGASTAVGGQPGNGGASAQTPARDETPPASGSEAPAAASETTQESNAEDPQAVQADEDHERQVAFEGAEATLLRAKDGLGDVPLEQLDDYSARIRDSVKELGLDPEDLAVILGRWNTTLLEHRRTAGRRQSKARR